jgi:hypothetical protein
VARITALHFGFHSGITAAPEAWKIARHLHRTLRWRQQLDDKGRASTPNSGMAVEPEQLLNPHCNLGRHL